MIDPREMAESLSPAMRHCVLRCSDAPDWTRKEEGCSWARDWCDVVAGHRGATFRRTIGGLVKRGIVVIADDRPPMGGVRLTAYGLKVQAALRS
jgi:hypothetical protein